MRIVQAIERGVTYSPCYKEVPGSPIGSLEIDRRRLVPRSCGPVKTHWRSCPCGKEVELILDESRVFDWLGDHSRPPP